MPYNWNDIKVVTIEELVPDYYNKANTVCKIIMRNKNNTYGLKKLNRAEMAGKCSFALIACLNIYKLPWATFQ